jgi:mannitol/fructose-specific phosphotransferase system IIA component (Ntr-type)
MNLDDFPDPNSPVIDLNSRDRWQAITELLDSLVVAGKIPARHRPAIESAVVRREQALSTAIGSGIGLPHALTSLLKEPLVAFGRSKRGINFDAPDKKPVFKVCLFLMPQGQFQKHVQLMASITKLLAKPNF